MRIASDAAPENRPRAYDAAILADLADAFGQDRLGALLDGLAGEIGKRLDAPEDDARRLADDAHALTSVSGTLGFSPLSLACAALERACLRGEDASVPLRIARLEADRAMAALAALRRVS